MVKNAIWLPGYQVMDELLEVEDGAPLQRFLVECPTAVDVCPKCGVIGRMGKHGTEQPAETGGINLQSRPTNERRWVVVVHRLDVHGDVLAGDGDDGCSRPRRRPLGLSHLL